MCDKILSKSCTHVKSTLTLGTLRYYRHPDYKRHLAAIPRPPNIGEENDEGTELTM